MEQLLCHLVGDYLVQSDWMALHKRKSMWACFLHCWCYAMCFWPLLWTNPRSPRIWCAILASHFLIDRFGLARYVVWAKNFLAPWTRIRGFGEVLDEFKARGEFGDTMDGAQAGEVVAEQKRPVRVNPPWTACQATGYPPNRDAWLTVWLLIIADNTLHLLCNYAALRWL